MRLHHSPTSPFVRKVMIVLHETGLTDRVALSTAPTSPFAENAGVVAANPLGRVPALERPDGPTLFDSRVICRYLDALAAGGLYPTGAALWSALTLEALADGICDSAVSGQYERNRPDGARSDGWIAAQKGKVARALDALEAQWSAHLRGPLDIGAIATAAALGYLDFRYAEMDWRAGRPTLADWHAGFAERPSYVATRPPG